MATMGRRGIVFDVDGTLLNGVELYIAAYHHIAHLKGYELPTAASVRECMRMAMPLQAIIAKLFPGANTEELLAINAEYVSANATEVAAYDGLHELLKPLYDAGYRMAILTGGNEGVNTVLKRHDCEKYFASIVHSGRLTKHKPDPEGYALAASEAGFVITDSIMIGDSPNDILTGKNAGALATIGITHGLGTRHDLVGAQADYIVDSLFDVYDVIATI